MGFFRAKKQHLPQSFRERHAIGRPLVNSASHWFITDRKRRVWGRGGARDGENVEVYQGNPARRWNVKLTRGWPHRMVARVTKRHPYGKTAAICHLATSQSGRARDFHVSVPRLRRLIANYIPRPTTRGLPLSRHPEAIFRDSQWLSEGSILIHRILPLDTDRLSRCIKLSRLVLAILKSSIRAN